MRHYLLEVEGKTYRMRIVAREHHNLESKLGGPVMKVLQDEAAMMSLDTLRTFLVIGARGMAQDQELTERNVDTLIDQMVDEGKSTEDFARIIMEIAEASGFFPQGTVRQAFGAKAEQSPPEASAK